MAAQPSGKLAMAYTPYETFRSFVETLHQTALPDKINKTLMDGMSNGLKSNLMVAIRFLGLIEGKDDVATPPMRELVSAFGDKDQYRQALKKIIDASYGPILGKLNTATATGKDLDDAFSAASGYDGTMLVRAERFYIKAMQDAGLSVSPHITKRRPRPGMKRTPPKSNVNGKTPTTPATTPANSTTQLTQALTETISFPLYFKDKPIGNLVVPKNLSCHDVAVVELMIPVLKAYAGDPAGEGK